MSDTVNHPAHYNQGGIECIDAIQVVVKHLSGFEGFCAGNALKYLWRWKDKGGVEDLAKARWYIDRLIEESMPGTVNHPSQHNWGGMDWIDVVKDVGGLEDFCVGSTIKYLWVWTFKRGLDDLQEARWYLDLLLDFKRYD